MIQVKLIATTDQPVNTLSSHAAKVCYTSTMPELGNLIDVKSRLFATGHHTTIEHNYFTFALEGLSVSSVVFGLHMNTPYYNSDQRSGRFSKMYSNPDFDEIAAYLRHFYPAEPTDKAVAFIEKGTRIYQDNIARMTELAARVIREDRPLATDKYIEQNAPKFAQEQLRMFISQATPTALDMTINTSALAALWRVAWSPEMREITDQMRDAVLAVQPDLAYMFDSTKRQNRDWTPKMHFTEARIHTMPTSIVQDIDLNSQVEPSAMDSVDILPFSPFSMANNTTRIKTEVSVSCATLGQDQRHRSISRTPPIFVGSFYVPPLLGEAGLTQTAKEYMQDYINLSRELSPALTTTIAPYGAMVMYQKSANLNALIHEQGKRLCWCAQEEISDLARQLRLSLKERYPALADRLAPPCYRGKCLEGVRFCGRQCHPNLVADYFVKRRV